MIPIESLTEASKDIEVVYTNLDTKEYGYIVNWNSAWIFVIYHTKIFKDGTHIKMQDGPQATNPESLDFNI